MALTEALIAALAAAQVPAKAGDRPVVSGTKPFVVLWPDGPLRAQLRMTRLGQTTTIVCHCFGLTAESARIAETKLAAAVYSLHRTVIDDQVVLWPEQLSSLPLTRDDDVSPPLYDLVVEWRLRTSPTT